MEIIVIAIAIVLLIYICIVDADVKKLKRSIECSRKIETDLQTQIFDIKHNYIQLELKAVKSKHDLDMVEMRRQAIMDKMEILNKHTMALDNMKTWATALDNDIQLLKTQLNNVEKTIGS
jgi:predicted Holliday junction resolvase-like endonuclease